MSRQGLSTYVMLTLERCLQLFEEIQARHNARMVANPPQDSLEPKEEEGEQQSEPMKGAGPEEEDTADSE